MKKLFLFIIFILLIQCFDIQATHIVGGEIQVVHLEDDRYDFILNLYFDEINGNPQAEDQQVTIYIFSKKTDGRMDELTLPREQSIPVVYTNSACQIGQLQTRRIQYKRTLILESDRYNDEEGYYVVWERCCRNGIISNINNPGDAGMTFYTEFPPVNIINTSPQFSVPKGDYACQGEFFKFDFSASDLDGDELRYSLATPLNGNATRRNPVVGPSSSPYALISWLSGYSATNAILGSPGIQLNSRTGEITFIASELGLFVFSVTCEEYRNGQKIGEVRRDYQLLVIDCPNNASPIISLEDSETSTTYQEGDTLFVRSQDARCFNIFVTDPDGNEPINLLIRNLNVGENGPTLSNSGGTLVNPGEPIQSELCWSECNFTPPNQAFTFEIIALDDGCPLPRTDTLTITLVAIPEPNEIPEITTSLGTNTVEIIVEEDLSFTITGTDADNDAITVEAIGRGFDIADLGMNVPTTSGTGNLTTTFDWESQCENVLDFETRYVVDFIITDKTLCFEKKDTTTIEIVLKDKPFFDEAFLPSNAFTPNKDGFNDNYIMPNLPEETCLLFFKEITIFNRWGNLVYKSNDRNFQWSASNLPSGVYFYNVDFNRKDYKGMIHLLK